MQNQVPVQGWTYSCKRNAELTSANTRIKSAGELPKVWDRQLFFLITVPFCWEKLSCRVKSSSPVGLCAALDLGCRGHKSGAACTAQADGGLRLRWTWFALYTPVGSALEKQILLSWSFCDMYSSHHSGFGMDHNANYVRLSLKESQLIEACLNDRHLAWLNFSGMLCFLPLRGGWTYFCKLQNWVHSLCLPYPFFPPLPLYYTLFLLFVILIFVYTPVPIRCIYLPGAHFFICVTYFCNPELRFASDLFNYLPK